MSYCSIATPQEMRVIRAIFCDDGNHRPGCADSEVNVTSPIRQIPLKLFDMYWDDLHPFNRQERILLARKVIAEVTRD